MPDIKYGKSEPAERYSNAPDYFDRCKESGLNIMPQYRPMGEARRYKELNRPITKLEFGRATDIAKSLGLTRGIGERERF